MFELVGTTDFNRLTLSIVFVPMLRGLILMLLRWLGRKIVVAGSRHQMFGVENFLLFIDSLHETR